MSIWIDKEYSGATVYGLGLRFFVLKGGRAKHLYINLHIGPWSIYFAFPRKLNASAG